ncbi:hypothetical protein [Halosimplex pelagicum]|uniref:DUF8155 domain-containing protein n=1 Tax=Halosimplex pelagicum TaxID=869886 RepID=A0A7D5T796_9EURY|nr:hypothetical protein [Halosimplex pelagicum]QLH80090.1 hypothetical protein HZS54_07635 [Halosimplex pelagicum]
MSSSLTVAAGDTYAVLDRPVHPAPGERFAGLAATDGDGDPLGVLDGGLPRSSASSRARSYLSARASRRPNATCRWGRQTRTAGSRSAATRSTTRSETARSASMESSRPR